MPRVQAIKDWVIAQGLSATGQEGFLHGLATRLAATMPLHRLSIGVPSLDPNIRGVSFTFENDAVLSDMAAYGPEGDASFRTSPIFHARQGNLTERIWNLDGGEDVTALPLLSRLADEGFRQYVLKLLAFPNESQIVGMALSFATRHENGFTPTELATIEALLPVIGLTVYRIELSRIARDILRVYVGPRTSDRILSGLVHRGEGEAIHAAILFADLKGFTALSETHGASEVVAFLNRRFDLLDEPIGRHGGEILKFMGDGLLAVFPLSAGQPDEVCRRALDAAREALAANGALNRSLGETGGTEIELDVALHLGEVFYGNIGASRRLDFTVIGPAVNVASRIEALCDRLGRHLLLSGAFARRCGVATVPLGRFSLKGIAEPQEVFGDAE